MFVDLLPPRTDPFEKMITPCSLFVSLLLASPILASHVDSLPARHSKYSKRFGRFGRRAADPATLSEGSLTSSEGCTQFHNVEAGEYCYMVAEKFALSAFAVFEREGGRELTIEPPFVSSNRSRGVLHPEPPGRQRVHQPLGIVQLLRLDLGCVFCPRSLSETPLTPSLRLDLLLRQRPCRYSHSHSDRKSVV